jgi:hypothetical protein
MKGQIVGKLDIEVCDHAFSANIQPGFTWLLMQLVYYAKRG